MRFWSNRKVGGVNRDDQILESEVLAITVEIK
jgi:hypothetical protein